MAIKKLKKEDLIHGTYYKVGYVIFCFKGFRDNRIIKNTALLIPESGMFFGNDSFQIDNTMNIKLASDLEIQWLNECIIAKKYISQPKNLTKPTLWL